MNKSLINFVQTNPALLMDEVSLKNHKVFSNPASLEKVSAIINEYEEAGADATALMAIRPLIAGYINEKNTDALLKHINKASSAFDPVEIVHRYHQGNIRERVQKARAKRPDKVGVAVEAVRELVIGLPLADVKTKQIQDNISNFMVDIPNELTMSFFASLTQAEIQKRHNINWSALLYSNAQLSEKLDTLFDTMHAIPATRKHN